jgi:hypothetical protein
MLWPPPAARDRRRGNVVVWVVVCSAVILGVLALGMDGGRMMEERRTTQAAADAAALAAARDLYFNYTQNQGKDPFGSARAAALASAAANGFANDGSNSVVTVNIPPLSGTFAGKPDHVEVIVQSNLPGTFSALFLQGPLPVQGRAVARGRPQRIGLTLLQPSGGPVLSASGNARVDVAGAPIVVNSTSTFVYDIDDNASVSADYHDIAGPTPPTGNISGPINTSVSSNGDPLASLPAPDPTAYAVQDTGPTIVTGNSVSLQPGVYQGGISISGGSVNLAPGIYILNGGGLSVSGNGSLFGTGVMIYLTGGSSPLAGGLLNPLLSPVLGGSISINGNGAINLTPPGDGTYQGINIFQDRQNTQPINITGNGSISITGTGYAPAATLQLTGSSNTTGDVLGGFIVNQATVSGSAAFSIVQGAVRPRVPEIGLVE